MNITSGIGNNMISGTWINPHTGNTITVRNVVNDGDSAIIITDKGQISMSEFQNYIQASDEIYDADGKVIGKESIDIGRLKENATTAHESKTPTIDDIEAMFDKKNTGTPSYANSVTSSGKQPRKQDNEESSSFKMIDKIFNKINVEMNVSVNITSNTFPTQELNMLKSFFDVTDNDIADYIRKKFITNDIINDSIQTFISGL